MRFPFGFQYQDQKWNKNWTASKKALYEECKQNQMRRNEKNSESKKAMQKAKKEKNEPTKAEKKADLLAQLAALK